MKYSRTCNLKHIHRVEILRGAQQWLKGIQWPTCRKQPLRCVSRSPPPHSSLPSPPPPTHRTCLSLAYSLYLLPSVCSINIPHCLYLFFSLPHLHYQFCISSSILFPFLLFLLPLSPAAIPFILTLSVFYLTFRFFHFSPSPVSLTLSSTLSSLTRCNTFHSCILVFFHSCSIFRLSKTSFN